MKGSAAATRYAKSLLDLAIEEKALDAVKADMDALASACATSRELQLLLESPIINSNKKKQALTAVFEKQLSKLTLNFVALIASKGREKLLPLIADSFIEQYKEQKGIVSAEVTTAVKLSNDDKKVLEKALSGLGKSIELNELVDPSIIGGLKVRVGDRRLDASIRKKLNELKFDIHN